MSEEIQYPSANQIAALYHKVITATGGKGGLLSRSNLEYILETVKDVGEKLPREKALVKKAGFLLYNVIIVHPFVNGNKRTSYELVGLFLESNGYEIAAETTETYRFLLGVAKGETSEIEVERWIGRHLAKRRSG